MFTIDVDSNANVVFTEVESFQMDRMIKDVVIVKSTLAKDDMYVILLPYIDTEYDTSVFLVKVN